MHELTWRYRTKRTAFYLLTLLLLGAMAGGAGKPLSKDEVIQLLTTGVELRVITLVHQYGIDFEPDEAAVKELRAAGGTERLFAALREEADKEARKRLALGDTFLQAGDLDGAETQFRQALHFDSRNADAHLGLGKVREQRGQTEAALAEYQEAIKARPDSGAAYNAVGQLYEKQGEPQKALEAYRSGLETEPQNAGLKANYIRLAAERARQTGASTAPPREGLTPGPAPQTGRTKVNSKDGLTYVWIPPGSTITKGFWMGQTEVTQAAYQRVMGTNPSYFHGERLPVERVTWDQANAYCGAVGMRLPTEAEWEYAARAGSTASRYGDLDAVGWYSGNSGRETHEVGQKEPNGWKLYDMLGNVWEWVADWYDEHSGQGRVVRGGSWINSPRDVRASYRSWYPPGNGLYNLGFRCGGEVP